MKKTVLKNAVLIDGEHNNPIEDALVVLENKTVTYAGKRTDDILEKHQQHAAIYDLNGKTIMPGLIDVHVHLSYNGDPDMIYSIIMEDAQMTLIKAISRAKKALEAGYTTLRTMGEKAHVDITIKKAIEQNEIAGPRIIASGNALSITGGHGDKIPSGIKAQGIAKIVDGEDQVRKGAREQLKLGADNIKLMATGGGSSIGPATALEFTLDEMLGAVEAAEEFGKTTGAHAIGARGIIMALKAGVRTIEHGTFLDEEGIELLLEKEAYLVPTLSAFKTLTYGREGGVPDHHLKKVEYYSEKHYENLKKALKAGVTVVTGTDAGTPFNYHGDNAYELSCLLDCGMDPMDAIKSSTKYAAEALRLDNLGTIQEGNIADIIVVDGNPLKDLNVLQTNENIKMVIKEGELVIERE
ncbi:amidohydrolase family protein [Alteribacillus sp. YIM 98480]|uniref:metal-dependent hydrolase family protein n=1 Tax=Alteribacillus sp. YIM 98480 TaxID=2606599 RepID=UPI00131A8368|nr:amidohydrolase family protein [Alteribacillus sp. YIM 98480]